MGLHPSLHLALLSCAHAAPPLSWDAAYARASALAAAMTLDEKAALLRGVGWSGGTLDKWWYVGNMPPIARLGIPPLKMQDAAGGFRTYWPELIGTVTCWPSLLSLAATWDTSIMASFSRALGDEFRAKGANAILGPSINVHRVPRGGRNFEYLSGEDPYLGARLAEQYVAGVQSRGVMSVMKHFVFNNQETHRDWESSVVDDKTAWELYYPPFEAAVRAGVSAAMCSYNRNDGVYACENDARLARDLKGKMGFRGFVQSDWGATHSTSVARGLDQEMPMSIDADAAPAEYWFSPSRLANASASAVTSAATRVLAAMLRLHLMDEQGCTPPNCQDFLAKNVTSDAHAKLARDAATSSIVLLKNDRSLLPLHPSRVRTIAIVGAASNGSAYDPTSDQGHGSWNTGDYYSGGGSGHVTAGYVVSPLEGISRRARAAGIRVLASPSDDQSLAAAAAAEADVTIVVGATTSGEALDRANLTLDGTQDALIAATAAKAKKTVVLLMTPGAVLTPWRDQVDAALVLFLGGQETGNAWASVLFGDHSPSGKLPVTFPSSEAETILPDPAPSVVYKEGLATGYRNKSASPAFPFGHGLSYTTFAYGAATARACAGFVACVDVEVSNTGYETATTVAQAYVDLGPAAAHPAPMLKGFVKTTPLLPGDKQTVTFRFTSRDLSYYDAKAQGWVQAAKAHVLVAASAADVKAEVVITPQRAVEY